jgi:hypothetical protein
MLANGGNREVPPRYEEPYGDGRQAARTAPDAVRRHAKKPDGRSSGGCCGLPCARLLRARKLSGWPKRCKLAHAFL